MTVELFSRKETYSMFGRKTEIVKQSETIESFFASVDNPTSEIPDSKNSGIDPEFLPALSKESIKDYLTRGAVDLMAENGTTEGIEQLMDIDFQSIDWDNLVGKLVEESIEGAWNFISFDGKVDFSIDPPSSEEVGLIFDTETFVTRGNFPIIATAISSKGLYIWLCEAWDFTTPYEPEFISLGNTPRLCVAHNASFDHKLIAEVYDVDSKVLPLCTKGLAKILYSIDSANDHLIQKKDPKPNSLQAYVQTLACKGDLLSVYNFTCKGNLQKADKKIRDMFVKAVDFRDFKEEKFNLLVYALKDCVYLLQAFQVMVEDYRLRINNQVVLHGIIQSGNGIMPCIPNYKSWLNDKQIAFDTAQFEIWNILKPYVDEIHEDWLCDAIDPVTDDPDTLGKLDFSIKKPFNYRKKVLPEGWVKMAKWYHKFITNDMSLKGNDLSRLMQLRWDGNVLYKTQKDGWYYLDKNGKMSKPPHKDGKPDQNVGIILSKFYHYFAKENILTSDTLPQDVLVEVLAKVIDCGLYSQYGNRMTNAFHKNIIE